jgi:hypothetical protein
MQQPCRTCNMSIVATQQWCRCGRTRNDHKNQSRSLGVNYYDDDDEVNDEDVTIPTIDIASNELNDGKKSKIKKTTSNNNNRNPYYYDDEDNDDDETNATETPKRDIKRFPVPDGPPPGPILLRKTREEAFFQFDYRNVPAPTNMKAELAALLEKIQLTMKDTELEPYHSRRGCETLRNTIDNLPDGAKFRVGGNGKKSAQKVGDGYNKAIYVTTHRALRKSMFHLLWERHAILTSGTTHDWNKLSSKLIAQSLLGPETRLQVDPRLGKEIIQELWIRGISSKYNRLVQRHKDRSAERNYIKYLHPPTKKEIAQMDWDTDLNLKSNEKQS